MVPGRGQGLLLLLESRIASFVLLAGVGINLCTCEVGSKIISVLDAWLLQSDLVQLKN